MSDLFYEDDLAAHRAVVRAMEEEMNNRSKEMRDGVLVYSATGQPVFNEPSWHPPGANDRARDIRANIRRLAEEARPTSEEDYGSDRQVDAENAFFAAVDRLLHPHQRETLEAYCLKGTTEENIEYALRLLSLDPANGHA